MGNCFTTNDSPKNISEISISNSLNNSKFQGIENGVSVTRKRSESNNAEGEEGASLGDVQLDLGGEGADSEYRNSLGIMINRPSTPDKNPEVLFRAILEKETSSTQPNEEGQDESTPSLDARGRVLRKIMLSMELHEMTARQKVSGLCSIAFEGEPDDQSRKMMSLSGGDIVLPHLLFDPIRQGAFFALCELSRCHGEEAKELSRVLCHGARGELLQVVGQVIFHGGCLLIDQHGHSKQSLPVVTSCLLELLGNVLTDTDLALNLVQNGSEQALVTVKHLCEGEDSNRAAHILYSLKRLAKGDAKARQDFFLSTLQQEIRDREKEG